MRECLPHACVCVRVRTRVRACVCEHVYVPSNWVILCQLYGGAHAF